MVDNFELISSLLEFPSDDVFYFLEIIKRKKDNPEMMKQRHLVKTYEIRNEEDLNVLRPSIVKWCNFDNARAYICLNGKSKKKSASNMLIELANIVAGRHEANLQSIYNSVVGDVSSNSSEIKKTWIIEIQFS